MPKVLQKRKSKGGKAESYRCDSCSDPIVPGQQYFEWSFRYGGTHRQHEIHGRPKQSQLTQSKMSGVYAAVESAEDAIASAESIEDLKGALDDCKGEVENVRDEYQEAIDNMISPDGAVAQDCQEKIDALETFMEELESTSDNLTEYDDEEEPEEPEESERDLESADWAAWFKSEPKSEQEPPKTNYEVWSKAHAEWEETRDQYLEDKRSEASDVLSNLSV